MSKTVGRITIVVASLVLLTALIVTASGWTRSSATHAPKATPATPPPVSSAPDTTPAPQVAPPGTVLHVVSKGELLPHVIRKYWVSSSFMTHAEMEAALRERNTGIKGISLKPGATLIIPGMEGPITQQPVPVARDYEVRAIYLTGVMAGSSNGLKLIQRWREAGGNAVVFDVKDSDGIVNIPFEHPLNTGGPHPYIPNLPKLTRWLHQQGLHAIARIAIFRDEKLVVNHPELAVQSRARHQAWRENGKLVWTDPSRPEVQQYNIALARQAALDGVDEVQFDYVRFPAEGEQKDAGFYFDSHPLHHASKGADGKEIPAPPTQRSEVITDFLSKAYAELHPMKVLFSLDVFGVMAWQRSIDLSHTGQDIPQMAKQCDVLSPMIYPSHFFGMDGYKVPGDAPEHFISESMERFKKITADSGVVLRPWLQAFGWKTPSYSPQYVETQVKVAKQNGGIGFLFWNARNDYSKPFAAMPQMRRNPQFIRGDELQKLKTATGQEKPAPAAKS
ncbi:MAG TPA: putative glycoside hydrolase [Terriglobales bacterium]|nr:putative glycoside hydrolase [Terriglobales bacterium]